MVRKTKGYFIKNALLQPHALSTIRRKLSNVMCSCFFFHIVPTGMTTNTIENQNVVFAKFGSFQPKVEIKIVAETRSCLCDTSGKCHFCISLIQWVLPQTMLLFSHYIIFHFFSNRKNNIDRFTKSYFWRCIYIYIYICSMCVCVCASCIISLYRVDTSKHNPLPWVKRVGSKYSNLCLKKYMLFLNDSGQNKSTLALVVVSCWV